MKKNHKLITEFFLKHDIKSKHDIDRLQMRAIRDKSDLDDLLSALRIKIKHRIPDVIKLNIVKTSLYRKLKTIHRKGLSVILYKIGTDPYAITQTELEAFIQRISTDDSPPVISYRFLQTWPKEIAMKLLQQKHVSNTCAFYNLFMMNGGDESGHHLTYEDFQNIRDLILVRKRYHVMLLKSPSQSQKHGSNILYIQLD